MKSSVDAIADEITDLRARIERLLQAQRLIASNGVIPAAAARKEEVRAAIRRRGPRRRKRQRSPLLSDMAPNGTGRRVGAAILAVAAHLFKANDWVEFTVAAKAIPHPEGRRWSKHAWNAHVAASIAHLVYRGWAERDTSLGNGRTRGRMTHAGRAWFQSLKAVK